MLNKDEVKKTASLARIGLSEKEIEKYQQDLSAILDWVEQLKEVDVAGVEPTAHISGVENIMREDEAADFGGKDKIVDLFPEKKDGFDKVKSVL